MSQEITVKIDLENYQYMDYKITESFIKDSIAEAVKDYFFTEEFKKQIFSEVFKEFILTTFKAELSVKCREIIQKASFSDIFGYSCSNPIAQETIIKILLEEKERIKIKLLELLHKSSESTIQEALISYINNELNGFTGLRVQLDKK